MVCAVAATSKHRCTQRSVSATRCCESASQSETMSREARNRTFLIGACADFDLCASQSARLGIVGAPRGRDDGRTRRRAGAFQLYRVPWSTYRAGHVWSVAVGLSDDKPESSLVGDRGPSRASRPGRTQWRLAEKLFAKRGTINEPAVLIVDASMLERIRERRTPFWSDSSLRCEKTPTVQTSTETRSRPRASRIRARASHPTVRRAPQVDWSTRLDIRTTRRQQHPTRERDERDFLAPQSKCVDGHPVRARIRLHCTHPVRAEHELERIATSGSARAVLGASLRSCLKGTRGAVPRRAADLSLRPRQPTARASVAR